MQLDEFLVNQSGHYQVVNAGLLCQEFYEFALVVFQKAARRQRGFDSVQNRISSLRIFCGVVTSPPDGLLVWLEQLGRFRNPEAEPNSLDFNQGNAPW